MASTTAVLPLTTAGARTETSPSSEDACGARTATTPVGSGSRDVEVRPGDGVEPAEDLGDTCRTTRHTRPTGRSPRRRRLGPARGDALGVGDLGDELGAAALHHLGHAVEHLAAVVGRGAGPAGERRRVRRRRRRGRPCGTPCAALARKRGRRRPRRGSGVHLVGAPGLAAGEGAADVELVGLADLEPRSGRGRRRAHRPAPVRDVGLEPVAAALAAVAGLLVAAERARRVEAVEGVGPHHAGPQLVGHPQDPRALLGPDARRQPVRRVVGLGDRLLRRAERQHRQDRAEDLLLGDAVRLGDAGEHRRRGTRTRCSGRSQRACPARGALGLAGAGELADAVELAAGVDRADVGVLVQRVADAQGRQPPLEAALRPPRRRSPAPAAATRRSRRGPG